MAEYEIYKHYNGEAEIKFYPNSHRYQKVGEKNYLVSASGATNMLDKSDALLKWAGDIAEEYLLVALSSAEGITEEVIKIGVRKYKEKRDSAATIGSMVHDWIDNYTKGLNPELPLDENVKNGVMGFLKWVRAYGIKFIASEKRIYSKEYGYAGTMDVIFTCKINPLTNKTEDNKIMHAGDYKTSSGFYLSQAMQLAGYEQAEQEEHGTVYGEGFIIKLDKETGKFDCKGFTREEMDMFFEGFLDCLGLKNLSKYWDKNHGYYSNK